MDGIFSVNTFTIKRDGGATEGGGKEDGVGYIKTGQTAPRTQTQAPTKAKNAIIERGSGSEFCYTIGGAAQCASIDIVEGMKLL